MNNYQSQSAIDHKKVEQKQRALIFVEKLEREKSVDQKIKLLVELMTYYDSVNAKNFFEFCAELYNDRATYSRDMKLIDKMKELDLIINSNQK